MCVNLLLFVEIKSHGQADESIFATFVLLWKRNLLMSVFSFFSILLSLVFIKSLIIADHCLTASAMIGDALRQ